MSVESPSESDPAALAATAASFSPKASCVVLLFATDKRLVLVAMLSRSWNEGRFHCWTGADVEEFVGCRKERRRGQLPVWFRFGRCSPRPQAPNGRQGVDRGVTRECGAQHAKIRDRDHAPKRRDT